MSSLAQAIIIAAESLDGLTDKQGKPAIFHALRVMMAGETFEEQVAGALHDVCEDGSHYSEGDIIEMFGEDVGNAVYMLTRHGEEYSAYITRLASNDLARAVKLNDLADNIARSHEIGAEGESLRKRYEKAQAYLRAWPNSAASRPEGRP